MRVRGSNAWGVVTLILGAVGSLTVARVAVAQSGGSTAGPRLIDPNSGASGFSRELPIAEPPSSSRDLPLPPLPSPPATTPQIPSRRPSIAPVPDRRFSDPRYSAPPQHESLRVPPPPDYGLNPSTSRPRYSPGIDPLTPRYDVHGPAPVEPVPAIPTRSYHEIARLTEKLAKQVREVHLHLHYRGQIVPVAQDVNNAREALEVMKRLQKAGQPIASIQSGYGNFVGHWHYLQARISGLAAYDPGLQQVINVTNAYDTVLRQALGYQ